jgi:hypothetical protein
MAGRIVSGGIQESKLRQREEAVKQGKDVAEFDEYETTQKEKTADDYSYEQKMLEASTRIAKRSTAKLLLDAEDGKSKRREQYQARIEYNQKMEKRREDEKDRDRGKYDRDRSRMSDRYGDRQRDIDASRRDKRVPKAPEKFEEYGKDSVKAYKAKIQFGDDSGYVTAASGYRYIPRDPNAPILHQEVKGWLHCWCQTKGFDKPEYEIAVEGRPPRQKFTVTLAVNSKRGEPLDIKPTVIDRSKKMACTNAAWAFVDELLKRGLLEESHAPKREDSEMKTTTSGITDCNAIDCSEEATIEGGGWTLCNCEYRLRNFCRMIKVPLDINMHAYGPDHDRKTDAHFTMRFQVWGEENIREYKCQFTTRNKKQAQAAVCLSIMRALYKDGLIEAYGTHFKPPPRVNFKMSSSGDFDPMDEELREKFGGWLPANSQYGLGCVLKHWRINPEVPCENVGRPGKDPEVYFKAELRIQLEMQTQNNFKTRHELYTYGKKKSKNDAKNQCACAMMRIFYKFGIIQQSHMNINRGGPNAHLWMIKPGQPGAKYCPEDVYVMNKLNDLRPAPEELAYPSTVVGHIEAALKCVSDWVHEEELQKAVSTAVGGHRTLLGMQRVGPIAMDMMLTGERRAHVVLTCGRRPTRKLLEKVAEKTVEMLQYTERGYANFNKRKEEIGDYIGKQREILGLPPIKTEEEKKYDEEMRKSMVEENIKNGLTENGGTIGQEDATTAPVEPSQEEQAGNAEKADKNADQIFGEVKSGEEQPSEDKPAENGKTLTGAEPEAPKPEESEMKDEEDEFQQPATPEHQGDGEINEEMENMQNDDSIVMHDENSNQNTEARVYNPEAADAVEIDIPIPDYYNVNIEHQNSGYLITYGIVAPHKMVVRVTLTSTLLRKDVKTKEEEEQKKHEKAIADQKAAYDAAEAAKKAKELADQVASEPPVKQAKVDGSMETEENKTEGSENAENKESVEKTNGNSAENSAEKTNEPTEEKPASTEPQEEFNQQTDQAAAPAIVPEPPKEVAVVKQEIDETQLDDRIRKPTAAEKKDFKFGAYLDTLTWMEIVQIEDEEGMLPVQPGLGALAELRRIKWYQHIGLNTPFLPDICRLIRGLAIRETSWRSFRILCPWTIALIVEVIIKYELQNCNNQPDSLSPARLLKYVLEVTGKGFRFPILIKKEPTKEESDVKQEANVKEEAMDEISKIIESSNDSRASRDREREKMREQRREDRRKRERDELERSKIKKYTTSLVDPCESGAAYDALAHISSQRKSDIRACAKYALDLLARSQINLLLNLDKIEGLERL